MAAGSGDQQARHQFFHVEASVKSPGGFGEVAMSVFEEGECMIRPIQGALEIAEHDVDPTGTGCLTCGAATGRFDDRMRVPLVDDGGECLESIAVNVGFWLQPT